MVYGQRSEIVMDAMHIRNHVVVTGCDANLYMFLSELR